MPAKKTSREKVKNIVDQYGANATAAASAPVEKVTSFADNSGMVWSPRITTPVLVDTCRECGVTISMLMDFNINVADLFEALWISCRNQATENKVSKELFMERVTPDILTQAFQAYWAKVSMAFPTMSLVERMNGGPIAKSPLDPGQ